VEGFDDEWSALAVLHIGGVDRGSEHIQAGATVTLTGCTVTASGGCVLSAGSTYQVGIGAPALAMCWRRAVGRR
jgi:hypothetical protein